MRPGTRLAAVGYVLAVSVLATLAQVTGDGHYYLAAVLLTLPAGIAAVIALFIGYGLVEQLATLIFSHAGGNRIDSATLAVTAPVNVLLFAAAAVADVVLVHQLASALANRRSARRGRRSGIE